MSIAPILEVGKYNRPSKSVCMFKARGLKVLWNANGRWAES
jgi:hypothetical protein